MTSPFSRVPANPACGERVKFDENFEADKNWPHLDCIMLLLIKLITLVSVGTATHLRRADKKESNQNTPLISIPDVECASKYARQDSFDPERGGPICLTEEEVAMGVAGGNPGQTIPEPKCPSGYARASAEPPDEYGDVPVCLTVDEAESYRHFTSLTPNANQQDETKMTGNINVRIHEFDNEGGEHTRLVHVPLDTKVEGKLNYQQSSLVHLKTNMLVKARDVVRDLFGTKEATVPQVFEGVNHDDDGRVPERESDYASTVERAK
jgi:hypothetical protein